MNNRLVPHRGIEHYVVEGTRGPVGIEIMFHVGDAFAIDGIDLFLRIFSAVPLCHDATDFLGAWSVEKNMEGVGILSQ